MPDYISGDRHREYHAEERVTWRSENTALVEFLEAYTGRSSFLLSVRSSLARYGWLTPAQATAVQGIIAQEAGRPEGSAEDLAVATATTDECRDILNGVYTISSNGEHLTYRIHSVQRGPLAGKRIVKIQQQYGEFAGFAFLTTNGGIKVWRRFVDEDLRNEKFIVWARVLLRILTERATTTDINLISTNSGMFTPEIDGVRWEVQASTTCRRCNRALTTPSSIDAGLGPECAQREQNRTTAADRHEPIVAPLQREQTPQEGPTPEEVEVARLYDSGLPEQDIYPTEAMLIGARSRDRRREQTGAAPVGEFVALLNRLNYTDRMRTCQGCGRMFTSRAGVSRHRNYCTGYQEDRQRYLGQAVPIRRVTPRQTTPATPNLSALGTRIDGRVWEQ